MFCAIDGLGINDLVPDVNKRETYEKFGEGLKIWDYKLVKGRKWKLAGGTVRINEATQESCGVGMGKETQSMLQSGSIGPDKAGLASNSTDGNDDENELELEVWIPVDTFGREYHSNLFPATIFM